MSQIEFSKKLKSKLKPYQTDYLFLILNQNKEMNIDNRKYWIDNGLMTTLDMLAITESVKKTRL